MSIYNKKYETMSREDLSKLQLERLQQMVDYCIKNVPFYQKKLYSVGIKNGKQIKKLSDISKIPFTTKAELQKNYPNGLLAVPMSRISRIHASSGTKGNPTIGYYTKKDLKTWTDACARVLCLNGLMKKDIVQNSLSYGLFTGALGFHNAIEKIGCPIIPASVGNTAKQLIMLKDFEVTAIMGTPSYIAYISELIKYQEENNFKIKKVFIGAERCTKSMKKMIETNLKCKVSENYGLTECFGPGVAGECEEYSGMHICEDIFYPEIIDPKTEEILGDEEPGELVFTSLSREAMPLLRYRTGDISSLNHNKCSCGRTSVRMKAPYTRTDDMFVFKGINVFPTQIEYALEGVEGISPYYKILLERKNLKDVATLYIELSNNKDTYNDYSLKKIIDKINNNLKEIVIVKMNIKLVNPNTLERATGKAKRVEDLRYEIYS